MANQQAIGSISNFRSEQQEISGSALEGLRPAATTGLWCLARARGYCTIKVSFVLWVSVLEPAVALADTVIV